METDLLTLKEIKKANAPFYLYALCYPDGVPFYIGKGTGDRLASHEVEANDANNDQPNHRVIRTIRDIGLAIAYRL